MADDGSTAFPELVFVLSSSPRLNIEASMSLVSIFGLKNSNNLIYILSKSNSRAIAMKPSPTTRSPSCVDTRNAETDTLMNPTLKTIKLFNISHPLKKL
jgi:hypothetical protein